MMIGYTKNLTGQMGNRLFQYHFMRQIAFRLNIGYFHPRIPDSVWFDEMEKKKLYLPFFKRKKILDNKTIVKLGQDKFIKCVESLVSKGIFVVLEPPLLGDLFFDSLYSNPNQFIKIKEEYKDENFRKINSNQIYIALHFRGADFETWNKDAILNFDYYKDSIDTCIDLFDDEIVFLLFTDDRMLDSYKNSIKYLEDKKLQIIIGNLHGPAINDFYMMSECDVIISTPSTFSIWAGILGKSKKIIHSQKWIDSRIQVDDKFWIDLVNSNHDIYKLWKTF